MFSFLPVETLLKASRYAAYSMLCASILMISACGGFQKNEQKDTTRKIETKDQNKLDTKVLPPSFSPAGGTYNSKQNVTLTSDTVGAAIYFTTDGSDPTSSSKLYSSPIVINSTTLIKAIATKANLENSEIKSENYEIKSPYPQPVGVDPVISNVGRPPYLRLSQKRWNITVQTVGSKILFAGGSRAYYPDPNRDSNVVDIYDASTNKLTHATLSEARSDIVSTSVGSKAIFAGGTIPGYGSDISRYTTAVDIYDATSDTWSTASLSKARGRISVTSVGTKAIFAGGDNYTEVGADDDEITATVDIYDSLTNTWSTANLARARHSISAISVGSKALFAGGTAKNKNGEIDKEVSRTVDIFDASTNTWSQAMLSNGNISRLRSVIAGDKAIFADSTLDIYDSGTNNWSSVPLPPNEAYIAYNPETNTWTKKKSHLRFRSYLTATNIGTTALFAGAYEERRNPRYDIDVYDYSSNVWSKLTLPLYPFDDTADSVVQTSITLGSKVIFARAPSKNQGQLIHIYDNDSTKWLTLHYDRPRLRDYAIIVGAGNKLYFAGGRDRETGIVIDTVDIYDLSTNQWN